MFTFAGDSRICIPIVIRNDTTDEGTELFYVVLVLISDTDQIQLRIPNATIEIISK